jgi:hypothetical protein
MAGEVVAFVTGGDRQEPPGQAYERVLLRLDLGTVEAEHPDAGDDQDGAKDIDDPVEPGEEQRAQADHDRAHDDGAQDAPPEHLGLGHGRDTEVLKDQDEDEEVVDRKRQLDEVAGEVLQRMLGALAPPEKAAEQHCEPDQPRAPRRCLPDAENVAAPVEHEQVDDQEADDHEREAHPRAASARSRQHEGPEWFIVQTPRHRCRQKKSETSSARPATWTKVSLEA